MNATSGSVATRLHAASYDAARSAPTQVRQAAGPPPALARPLVVGVDGSAAGSAALVWAATEATHEGLPLHLVHAFEVAGVTASPMVVAPLAWYDPEWSLRAAGEQVAALVPALPTTTAQSNEPPTEALVRASHAADLVVVGTRGHSAAGALLLGSTAARVAAHAACPVVVVRETPRSDAAARVVVGLDGSPTAGAALAVAADWAVAHGCRLTVLHAWPGDLWVDDERMPDTVRDEVRAMVVNGQTELAEALLQPVREVHPDLPVDVLVITGDPGDDLVDLSEDARLVVVGSRGRGLVKGLVLGSVSERVLHHAHCPVMVVPPGASRAGRRAAPSVTGHRPDPTPEPVAH